jgi:hypothetical protein
MSLDVNNPYQAPETNIIPEDSEQQKIRLEHLGHEASIKSVGMIFYLIAIPLGLSAASYAFIINVGGRAGEMLLAVALIVLTLILIWTAVQLRRLNPGARIPATLFSIVGLAGFPIVTVIGLYSLYVIHCKKGRTILSGDYQQIVRATPELRYRTPAIIWIGMILLLLLIATAIILPSIH